MDSFTETVNLLAATGTFIIGVLALVGILLHGIHHKKPHRVLDAVTKWLLWIGFGIALAGVIFSLTYSGVIGYAPCDLCCWARIFIYPQAILYGLALFGRDRKIFRYTLALSLVGLMFAMYQNYLVWGGTSLIACDTGASCTALYVNEFGFITIQLMALFSQLGLVAVAWIGLTRNGE